MEPLKTKDHWTVEEEGILIQMVLDQSRDNGQVAPGFDLLAAQRLNRSVGSIKRYRSRLVRAGLIPRAAERAQYVPLNISDTDAAWLAGILDGEGTVRTKEYTRRCTRNPESVVRSCHVMQLTLVYNTDSGIIDKVTGLIPFSKKSDPYRGGLSVKDMYRVVVTGSRNIYVTLRRLLPFMQHTEKRRRAKALLEEIETRVRGGDSWLKIHLEE